LYGINLDQVWPHVNDGLFSILLVIAAWAVWEARSYLSIHAKFLSASTQQKITDNLNTLLNDGINYAMTVVAEQEKNVKPTTDSLVVKLAAQFAADHAGKQIDKTSEQLKQMVIAKLPSPQSAVDTTGTTVKTTLVTTETLPAIGAKQ